MSTLRNIIYDVREAVHAYSDDSNISDEYIAYQINITRNLLLRNKFSSRGFTIPQKLRQNFHKQLELVDTNDFVTGLGTILRTVDPIDYPIEPFAFRSNMRITSSSYLDPQFNLVLPERFPYLGMNKWNQNQVYVTIGTDYRLYFTSSNPSLKLMKNIKLSMVCENPETAYPNTINYNSDVDFWDSEYPLDDATITEIVDLIVKKIVGSLQIPEDKINNADAT